jgi:hypothetical protein
MRKVRSNIQWHWGGFLGVEFMNGPIEGTETGKLNIVKPTKAQRTRMAFQYIFQI